MLPPRRELQFEACGHDDCYGAMQEYFEDSEPAIAEYCNRTSGLSRAEAERDPLRYRFGNWCFEVTAVQTACRCVNTDWQRPSCAADECYRGVHQGLKDDPEAVYEFCRKHLRNAPEARPDPEAAIPGLAASCHDGAALEKACRCAIPSNSEWTFSKCPGKCNQAIDIALDGQYNDMYSFCRKTRRELFEFGGGAIPADYAPRPDPGDGCADARDVDTACSCIVQNEHLWTTEACAADKCYRGLDAGTADDDAPSLRNFCKTWRRSGDFPDIAEPTIPGLDKACPQPADIETACNCTSPDIGADWTFPECTSNQCYRALDVAVDNISLGIRGFCYKLSRSQRDKNFQPPNTPGGLDEACPTPEALVEACSCIEPKGGNADFTPL
ncbi:hypothetical protein HRG_006019 [Hirsutella rhossiliensis]|uniref:Uncharacterized protein n=1 Tax=Hirsutella rhossiliensis TaxID=111463 RepID=A0A9P8N054_9HYPO|nr:uncharacterized protein HRG_06019 [Hirsutella rhossiliensis]KAH0963509.1 hypothetical protein HRG_06019 [Hirsutella rhossiliensis]